MVELLAEYDWMTAGSTMSNSQTRGFPFKKLPAELRDKIYRYHLILPGTIKPTTACGTSFMDKHHKNCLLGKHRWIHNSPRAPPAERNSLRCTDIFTGVDQYVRCPESVLALLLVSRQINAEATYIFYRFNNFGFVNIPNLQFWLTTIGPRYVYLGELSFGFSSGNAKDVFTKLQNCPFLTKLHIDMHHNGAGVRRNKEGILASATGMKELRAIRGIKVLELIGYDRKSVPAVAGGDGWQEIDIMHADAIGPRLRRDLMTPRPEEDD